MWWKITIIAIISIAGIVGYLSYYIHKNLHFDITEEDLSDFNC